MSPDKPIPDDNTPDDAASDECPPVDAADLGRVLQALEATPDDEADAVEANVGLVGSLLADRPDYYRAAVIMRLMAFGAAVEAAPELIDEFMEQTDTGVVISQALLTAAAQAPITDPHGFDITDLAARARATSRPIRLDGG